MKVNGDLLGQLLGEVLTFHGDESGNVDDPCHEEMTGEAMATINCGGLHLLTLSVLRLKIGAPVMLFRNMCPLHDLYNGTQIDNTSRVQPNAWKCG